MKCFACEKEADGMIEAYGHQEHYCENHLNQVEALADFLNESTKLKVTRFAKP